jgi:hypothetical protein
VLGETQNTFITLYRGTVTTELGDVEDSNTPVFQDVPATVVETGSVVQDPTTQTPRTIRQVIGLVPEALGVTNQDRILDQTSGDVFIVTGVTKPPTLFGIPVAIRLDLKRVSATGS